MRDQPSVESDLCRVALPLPAQMYSVFAPGAGVCQLRRDRRGELDDGVALGRPVAGDGIRGGAPHEERDRILAGFQTGELPTLCRSSGGLQTAERLAVAEELEFVCPGSAVDRSPRRRDPVRARCGAVGKADCGGNELLERGAPVALDVPARGPNAPRIWARGERAARNRDGSGGANDLAGLLLKRRRPGKLELVCPGVGNSGPTAGECRAVQGDCSHRRRLEFAGILGCLTRLRRLVFQVREQLAQAVKKGQGTSAGQPSEAADLEKFNPEGVHHGRNCGGDDGPEASCRNGDPAAEEINRVRTALLSKGER